ncbi:MAG: agmatine deiminase family protein [Pirellulaceae bacterium]
MHYHDCDGVGDVHVADLSASMARLAQWEMQIQTIDKDTIDSIDDSFAQQQLFMLRTARQSHPLKDAAAVKLAYRRDFSRFVNNERNLDAFPLQTATAYHRLGQIHALEGNHSDAIKSLQNAIQIAERERFNEQVVLAKNTLGRSYTAIGKYKLAFKQFTESASLLERCRLDANTAAIIFRNLGVLQQMSGADGLSLASKSIRLLESTCTEGNFSISREFLIDFRMTMCDMLWSQGRLSEAADTCTQARAELLMLLTEVQESTMDTYVAAPNRYRNAIAFTDRNLATLNEIRSSELTEKDRCLSSSALKWQRLVNLDCEVVPDGLSLQAQMVGEFEKQSGLALAWGSFDWTLDAVTEIVQRVQDHVQVQILVDDYDSLDDAKSALQSADVPTDNIRFTVCGYESPWFRDAGPIPGKSAGGNWIWFDSCLTRETLNERETTDALPRIIAPDWGARVVPTPLHVEGGTILSNGKGLTICSTSVIESNREYGFDDAMIEKELQRITGAKKIIFVHPLIGESTGHIDMFMTFTDSNTVVVSKSENPNDPNRQLLDRHATTLGNLTGNEKLEVIRLPMREERGVGFQSYTNVVFANGVLLVPSYANKVEDEVRATYERLLPDWRIEFIDCSRLLARGGALHCLVSNLGGARYQPIPIRKRSSTSKTSQSSTNLASP